MGHLPKRSAGGVGGAGFGIYSCMDASSVKPFVQFSFSPITFGGGGHLGLHCSTSTCFWAGCRPRQDRLLAFR